MERLKTILASGAVIIGTVIVGAYIFSSKDNLDHNLFHDSYWTSRYNEGGEIWSSYMAEEIFHNKHNWKLYQEEVNRKNNGKLEGTVLFPDLDGNRSVGKSDQFQNLDGDKCEL